MVINNYTNNYTLSSYNMQQKVGIMHSIRIETSYVKYPEISLIHFRIFFGEMHGSNN